MAKSKQPVLLTMEKEAEVRAKGFTAVCGIDEAGRGPLAGPVVAAAVILPEGIELPGVNDSKKICAGDFGRHSQNRAGGFCRGHSFGCV